MYMKPELDVPKNTEWQEQINHNTYLPSHYIIMTKFQYILIIFIAWEFATN